MRRFLRHSTSFPIEVCKAHTPLWGRERLHDLSTGGLCFSSAQETPVGTPLLIRIPCGATPFEAEAKVVWCRRTKEQFEVGVIMLNPEDAFRARIVEQVFRIKEYQQQVLENEGRRLSDQDAASEWIARFAGDFPELTDGN